MENSTKWKTVKVEFSTWRKLMSLKALTGKEIYQIIEERLHGIEPDKLVDEILRGKGTNSENQDREEQDSYRIPAAKLEIE
ncbi:MAG TPA: hypothetical protein EYP90_01665 [Chromatiaceae bacterium]|nr:hypothetical protein [Chromatiaceae bacterium]